MKDKIVYKKSRNNKVFILSLLMVSILILLNNQNTFAQCNTIIDVDFNNWNNRRYSIADIKSDFNNKVKPWTASTYRGVEGPGAASNLIENTPQETRIVNGTLRAQYLKNDASGRSGGFLFDPYFNGVEEAYLEYKVKFDDNFFWATGGKLPGLGGSTNGINSESTGRGSIPSGCKYNTNGWSARLMWRRNRAQTDQPYLILYSYFADKTNGDPRKDGDCGDAKRIYSNLKDNRWYTIRQYIKMNTPGQRNGTVIMWIDGVETYRDNNAKIRNSGKDNLKINALIMNTYRGGSRTDPVWHSPRTEYTFFDDFKVWTNCTGGNGGDNKPPTIAITSPSASTYNVGDNITVNINANDADGNITKHEVFVNNQLVDTDGSTYTAHEINNLQAGNYEIKVTVTDNDGAKASATKNFSVGSSSNQSPKVSFSSPSGNPTVAEGYNLVVVANASDPDGSVSSVKLYINNQLVREEKVPPYEWGHSGSPDPSEVNGLSTGTYTFKVVATDNKGATAQDTFKLTVTGSGGNGGSSACDYGTPVNSGIPAMDKVTYSNVHVIGTGGPKLSNFRKFTINWVPSSNGLYQFAINTDNGSPDWYMDFKETMSFQLRNAKPEVTLRNTGFSGLDGSYWIARDGANLALVSKDKDFTIYFSNSGSAPGCDRSGVVESLSMIKVYPNPVTSSILNINGMPEGTKVLQIVDLRGSVIKELKTENTTENVDVSELATGSYFLVTKAAGFKESVLIIKN